VLEKETPDIVLVQDDTNTVLVGTLVAVKLHISGPGRIVIMRGNGFAGALAAAKLHIPVGQVEVGFVSFDRMIPEEINRVVADHISDPLFAPTETARQHLLNEGIDEKNIFMTGNTIIDAVFRNLEISI